MFSGVLGFLVDNEPNEDTADSTHNQVKGMEGGQETRTGKTVHPKTACQIAGSGQRDGQVPFPE